MRKPMNTKTTDTFRNIDITTIVKSKGTLEAHSVVDSGYSEVEKVIEEMLLDSIDDACEAMVSAQHCADCPEIAMVYVGKAERLLADAIQLGADDSDVGNLCQELDIIRMALAA